MGDRPRRPGGSERDQPFGPSPTPNTQHPTPTMILFGRVLTGGRELPPSRIVVEGGRIVALEVGGGAAGADLAAGDGWIAPGLLDLQVNGAGGVDLASAADPAGAVERVAATLAAHGVTAFCPTLVSSPRERILAALPAFAAGGASLGAHV